jgi:phage FluMu protein Com
LIVAAPDDRELFEVRCPHCGKRFNGRLIMGSAARYVGFKCPRCKLFVPYERADERELIEPTD